MEPITLPGSVESLDDLRRYVAQAAEAAGLDKRQTYRLCLAVDEIATNAIVHGYEDAGLEGVLRVWAETEEGTLKVILEDAGPPYNPLDTPVPTDIEAAPEDRQIGGLGVYLTLKGVDELLYERAGEWNRNIFVVRRAQPAESPRS